MAACMMLYLTILLSSLVLFAASQTFTNVQSILNDIFITRRYDKRIRPVKNLSHCVNLSVDIYMIGINSLDEKSGVLSTSGFLEVKWKDELLTWNPEYFENVTRITLPQDNIWIPDLFLRNGVRDLKEMGGPFYYVVIKHTGEIIWWPKLVFETHCEINIFYFPFDTQICQIAFLIWSHDVYMVRISTGKIDLYEAYENSVWAMESNFSSIEKDEWESYSKINFLFLLRRKQWYYIWNVLIPILFLGILKIFACFIPAKSGEKVSYAITVFLAYGVFLNLIGSILPENSDSICLVCMYMEIELTLSVFLVFITCLQVKVCSDERRTRLSKCECCIIRCMMKKYRVTKIGTHLQDAKSDWTLLSSAIDNLMLLFMVIVESVTLCTLSLIIYFK